MEKSDNFFKINRKTSKKSIKCAALLIYTFIFVFSLVTGYISYLFVSIPDKIVLYKNERYNFDKSGLFSDFFTLASNAGTNGKVDRGGNFTNTENNEYSAQVKFAGLFNVKNVNVKVIDGEYVVPCGNAIGVKLYCSGIMITEICTFRSQSQKIISPSAGCGLKAGDIITHANGSAVKTVSELSKEIAKSQNGVKISYMHGKKTDVCSVIPQKDEQGTLRIGLTVKDSAAGIGTLTYVNPKTKSYGALGHGVCENTCDKLMPVSDGEIDTASIISVVKGKKGIPGELHGMFASPLGTVKANTELGLYGDVRDGNFIKADFAVPVSERSAVKCGRAQIICCVNGTDTDVYDIEIEKIPSVSFESTKGMIIKITDERLLNLTGGIVQGMSGSPIIQNGALAGAVTHVFVNDPTRGYGIFAENMITESNKYR